MSSKYILATTVAILLFSCKKITSSTDEVMLTKPDATRLEDWFNNQTKLTTTINKMPTGTVLFNSTRRFTDESTNITPIKIDNNNPVTAANKFLVTTADATGQITRGDYYFVLYKTKPTPGNTETMVTPDFLSLKKIPASFNGAIIKYDLNNNLMASTHIEKGKIVNGKSDILSTEKINTNTSGKEVTTNLAPPPPCDDGGGQVCIDWYWQTWINGVLVDEEYVGTSCHCGGGGGGTATNTCQQSANAFFSEGSVVSEITSSNIVKETMKNKIDDYSWKFFTAGTWGILSYERINWTRENANMAWIFSSYTSLGDSEVGMSIGGTRTYKIINKSATSYVSSVVVSIIFTVTHQPVCNGFPIPSLTMTYPTANCKFIPKKVAIVND